MANEPTNECPKESEIPDLHRLTGFICLGCRDAVSVDVSLPMGTPSKTFDCACPHCCYVHTVRAERGVRWTVGSTPF